MAYCIELLPPVIPIVISNSKHVYQGFQNPISRLPHHCLLSVQFSGFKICMFALTLLLTRHFVRDSRTYNETKGRCGKWTHRC
jgi:hypothetical protein